MSADAYAVPCPSCQAAAGDPCIDRRKYPRRADPKPTRRPHAHRQEAASDAARKARP